MIFLDVSMDLDFAPASASEDVADTVDYAGLSAELVELAARGRFRLVETLAEACAAHVLASRRRVERVRVVVHKPCAVPCAVDVRARVERRR